MARHRLDRGAVIYIKFGRRLRIPVNPEEIEDSMENNDKTYTVLGVGQIAVLKRPKLREIKWQSFFPASDNDPWVNDSARDPETYVEALREAMEDREVGRLIISRAGLFDTNMRCTVASFTVTDKGGEPGDIYYEVEFREYRDYSPQTVSILTTTPTTATGPASDPTLVNATAEGERPVETPVMRVGASVIANGSYWYTSEGSEPHGTANNLSATVRRIVDGAAYPILINDLGWVQASQLQIVG